VLLSTRVCLFDISYSIFRTQIKQPWMNDELLKNKSKMSTIISDQ
jgi:hypothetical protein